MGREALLCCRLFGRELLRCARYDVDMTRERASGGDYDVFGAFYEALSIGIYIVYN